ncbi:fimbria/pilus outer membrane usher protein [Bordetella sp. BOR01]|uniref:fimbria/pilus outer membrane usher protein n=1 Tax=Bordetella sp. BOR01 TaxID=2854779 RepID=UPI001C482CD0|nr:fimbria/pilus outer membrane usher protein [Bordetella sp. BOR01]MBV7484998.1 fimbrial biogenesis outer membrane usher protein [Bordetella sp. BOR01]
MDTLLSTSRPTGGWKLLVPIRASLAALLAFGAYLPATAQPEFNLKFLRGSARDADISAMASPGAVLPGTYPFIIYINGTETAREDVVFAKTAQGRVAPCLSASRLRSWSVTLPETDTGCVDLQTLIPDAHASYNGNQQRLDLSVPQQYLAAVPRGYVAPSLRDQGINAAFLNYNLTGMHNHQKQSGRSDYFYGSFGSGINLGAWRLRHNATVNHESHGTGTHWRNQNTWAERDLQSIRSRMLLGDGFTSNSVFDSVQFRGGQLASDDEMLPYSQRSYAPVVRGVAASSARVEIRQDGNLIYAVNVAPGPFLINDIVPNRMSGDLEVSVIEADGSVQRYRQAFSAVETMLRPGLWRHEISAGELRNGYAQYRPVFLQGTVARGLESNTTPYGGLLLAEHYAAAALGVAQSLGEFGSASVDVTAARTKLANGDIKTGQSYRFLYSKSLNDLGTEFRLVGHRYSTANYYDFNDAAAERDRWRNGYYESAYWDPRGFDDGTPAWASSHERYAYSTRYYNKRNRLDLAINQRLSDQVSLYANYSNQTYWGSGDKARDIQVGLNGRIKTVNYGLFLRDTRSQHGYNDRMAGVSIAIPLGRRERSRLSSSSSYTHSRESGSNMRTGINGTALDDSRLAYGMNIGHSDSSGASGSANVAYQGGKAAISAGAASSEQYSQFNWGLSGGLLAHGGGMTFSQPLQRTIAVVHAPGGAGIGIENQAGVRVDDDGYAVVPGMSPYRFNRVALRTDDLGGDIDASKVAANVVPTRGAIVRIDFDTRRGNSLMIRSTRSNGQAVPLGANVFNAQGLNRGVAGPQGQIFVSGVQPGDVLSVRWGDAEDEGCLLDLGSLPAARLDASSTGYQRVELLCRPQGRP